MLARFEDGEAACCSQVKHKIGRQITESEPENALEHISHLAPIARQSLGKASGIEGKLATDVEIGGGAELPEMLCVDVIDVIADEAVNQFKGQVRSSKQPIHSAHQSLRLQIRILEGLDRIADLHKTVAHSPKQRGGLVWQPAR